MKWKVTIMAQRNAITQREDVEIETLLFTRQNQKGTKLTVRSEFSSDTTNPCTSRGVLMPVSLLTINQANDQPGITNSIMQSRS